MARARASDRDEGPAVAEPSPEVAPQARTTSERPLDEPRARSHDASGAHRAAPHAAQREPGGAEDAPVLGRNPEVEDSAFPPHEPGAMDISHHEETYQRFIRIVIRTVIAIFAVLILLALING